MSNIDDAIQTLGELFIIGFNGGSASGPGPTGLELTDDTAAFLSQARIGGVILFAHNYENPGQVAELINQVQECRTELPLWIGVDHEGGKVQRFKKGFTKIPEAAAVGMIDSPKLAFELSEMMAKELRAVGINLNFAPVADIATNPKNPVIGSRAYGSTEEQVTKMVTAILRGHLVAHVQPCIKHFPGHGDTSIDSHFALPRVDTPLETLRDRELRPFVRAFKSRCSMVMSAHIICSKLDPDRPATLSSKILRDLLRKELRYSKVVISDDMEMKAITDHFGEDDAPRLAIEAGCDLLCYRSEPKARHAYQALVKALENGKLAPELVLESAARSRALKTETLLPYRPAAITDLATLVGTPENQAIVDRVLAAQKPENSR
ncbi:MAG: beta-N-acetylhexosaminidase [Oligoflexia bacterium]|nr:beta-N-acetylhexosaminidase [Oligoflexia bacterium]